MVNGGVLEVGAGGSGWRGFGFCVRDPQGRGAVASAPAGCISPALHATNRWDWTEGVGEVRAFVREPRVPGFGPGGYRNGLVQRVSLSGTARISVASRSAAPPTRLETRTKESNMRASHWVY